MKHAIQFSLKAFALSVIALTLVQARIQAQKVDFEISKVVPAAQGSVDVSTNKDKGYNVDVNILHLAAPMRLSQPAKTYIVWMDTQGNGTKNLGEIQSKDGFMSKTLKAWIKTTTPFKPMRIFITAEDVAAVSAPKGQEVLTTKMF